MALTRPGAIRRTRRTGVYENEAPPAELDADLSALVARVHVVTQRRLRFTLVACVGFVVGTIVEGWLGLPFILETWAACFGLIFAAVWMQPWPRERIVFARVLARSLGAGTGTVRLRLDLRSTKEAALYTASGVVTPDGRRVHRFAKAWLELHVVLPDGATLELVRRELIENDIGRKGTHAGSADYFQFEDAVTFVPSKHGYRDAGTSALARVTGETLGLPPGIRLVTSEVTDERVRIVVRSERDTEADALLSHRKLLQDGSVEVLLRWIGSVATVRSPGRDGA
jgi:hypothetical protein